VSERFALFGGATIIEVKVAEDDVTILEVTLQPGAGAGDHAHANESETIVVVEGALMVSGTVLRAGETVHLARGVRHSFANETKEVTRALFVCVPGGLERFFRAVAAPDATDESVAAAAEAAGLSFD
jgi:quercetin dioxygenase-like cupin family protein